MWLIIKICPATPRYSLQFTEMVCGGRFPYYLLISLAVTLITYNAIISSPATLLAPGFPGRRGGPFSRSSSSDRVENRRRLFHTAVTSSDSAYNAWQCRVMYYWFKKAREARPDVEMGGFTRILHSGRADNLMDEIPTFVADPLPNGMDQVIQLHASLISLGFSFWGSALGPLSDE